MTDPAPRHCTDPEPHPAHTFADDTEPRHCPATVSERDGLLALLREAQRILNKWAPYGSVRSSNCVYAVAELNRLLNPGHTEEAP